MSSEGMAKIPCTSHALMAVINEPLFVKLNAAIEIQPAVSLEELIDNL